MTAPETRAPLDVHKGPRARGVPRVVCAVCGASGDLIRVQVRADGATLRYAAHGGRCRARRLDVHRAVGLSYAVALLDANVAGAEGVVEHARRAADLAAERVDDAERVLAAARVTLARAAGEHDDAQAALSAALKAARTLAPADPL